MNVFFALLLALPTAVAQLELGENSINLHSSFPRRGKECNIYDEAVFCQQVVIDQRMSLVAVSHKCSCPSGYRCPNDISDTEAFTYCEWDDERHYNRCRMRCAPEF